jgi:hypothetical protein
MHWVYESLRDDLEQAKYNMKRSGISDLALTEKINELIKDVNDIEAEQKFEEKLNDKNK